MNPEQQRQKDLARNEALDHMQYANVMNCRSGVAHEDHKNQDMAEHSHKVRGSN
jgi:hypothetical protein